jgi:lysophospholipase L1-like esterase
MDAREERTVKTLMKYMVLIGAGILAGTLLAELTIMLLYPQPLRSVVPGKAFFLEFDPLLGWRNKRNAHGTHEPVPGKLAMDVAINDKGLRGMEIPYDRIPGKKRVLALGDSITFGHGVSETLSYPYLLEQRLGADVEVINAGTVGYGTDQQYLFFRSELHQYRPDIVILGISANDIFDSTCSVRFGANKPYFRLVNGRLAVFNQPVMQSMPADEVFFSERPVRRFLFHHSQLARFIFNRVADPNRIYDINRQEMDIFEGMGVVRSIVGSLKEECRKYGCDLYAVVIPREDMISASLREPGNEAFLKRGHLAVTAILKDLGIPYNDMWHVFRHNNGAGLFITGDPVHPNERGHELIAGEIYDHLKDSLAGYSRR